MTIDITLANGRHIRNDTIQGVLNRLVCVPFEPLRLAHPDIHHGCRRLAELSHTALLGIEFTAGLAGPWAFARATPVPDLRLGGEALLDTLAGALRGQQKPQP